MKYRKFGYDTKCYARVYPSKVDDYQWSDIDHKPVVVGKIDAQAEIQSYEDCALSKVLEKYGPEELTGILKHNTEFSTNIDDELDLESDAERIMSCVNIANELRVKYKLPNDLPMSKIFDEVRSIVNNGYSKHVNGADALAGRGVDPFVSDSNADSSTVSDSEGENTKNIEGGKAE